MKTINLTATEVYAVTTAIVREISVFTEYVRQMEAEKLSSSDVDMKYLAVYNERIDALQSVLDQLS